MIETRVNTNAISFGSTKQESTNDIEHRKNQLITLLDAKSAALLITYATPTEISSVIVRFGLTEEEYAYLDKLNSLRKMAFVGITSGNVKVSISEPQKKLLLIDRVKQNKHGFNTKQPYLRQLSTVVNFILNDETDTHYEGNRKGHKYITFKKQAQ